MRAPLLLLLIACGEPKKPEARTLVVEDGTVVTRVALDKLGTVASGCVASKRSVTEPGAYVTCGDTAIRVVCAEHSSSHRAMVAVGGRTISAWCE